MSYTPNQQQRTIAKAVAGASPQPGFFLPHLATDADLRKPSSRLEPRRFV